MSKKDVIAQLAAHADELRAALSDHLPALIKALRRLSERVDHRRAWDDLAALVMEHVPPETGLPRAFVGSVRGTAVLDSADEEVDWADVARIARALLTTLDLPAETALTPDEILAAAKVRLLREPALTRDELRSRGGDPERGGLIRLVRADGAEVLPAFQFGLDGEPLPVVLEINRILGAERDRWGAADWWLSHSARLGAPPATLLGGESDDRLLAAAASVRGRL